MLAAQLLIVIVACLGQITCTELNPDLKRCQEKVFDDPGYSLGCTYTCKSGNRSDDTEYWGIYCDATVCVALRDGDPDKFDHIGTCKNGVCVEYTAVNVQQVWSILPETQPQFHDCDPKSSKDPVDKCLYICKKSHEHGKDGYFYGIYQDNSPCNFKNTTGQCRSGMCVDQKIAGKYSIQN
uniref:Basic tail protein n=1 Tax=Ixodes ricinus TaxID=34613 RepID=A0A147BXK5_IXORI